MATKSAWVPACEKGNPGGCALSHDIVVGEQSTTIGEFVDVRGVHLWVVVAHITPSLVIGQDNDYIGLAPKDLGTN